MTDYILGGYFVVRAMQRIGCMNNDLLPDKIISVSNCISDVMVNTRYVMNVISAQELVIKYFDKMNVSDVECMHIEFWLGEMCKKAKINWQYRVDNVHSAKELGLQTLCCKSINKDIVTICNKFGIPTSRFKRFSNWVAERHNSGDVLWEYGFSNLSAAREFCHEFVQKQEDVYLLGIGLQKEDADIFLLEVEPSKAGQGLVGDVLMRQELLTTENILGYDVLGYGYQKFHSYICNGFEDQFNKLLNMKPNQYGFFGSYDNARKAAAYLDDERNGAEPAFWQPWAIGSLEI